MDVPAGLMNYREQILELYKQLMEYIQKINQNHSQFNDRLNKVQDKIDDLLATTMRTKDIDVDRFRTMETKLAEVSEDINNLKTIINEKKGRFLNIVHQHLCELCSNAIVRHGKDDEIEFVICTRNVNGFPLERKCSEFTFDNRINTRE